MRILNFLVNVLEMFRNKFTIYIYIYIVINLQILKIMKIYMKNLHRPSYKF